MSIHAGTILHVGGANVIDRIQSAGVGDARIPIETIREVGNRLVVDKVPGEPDFNFTMQSLDVSTDLMALLTGKIGAQAEPAGAPGAADAVGTEYRWDTVRPINICSPWKDAAAGAAGNIVAGHLIPGYTPTRIRYRFGVTDNASQEVELAGGSYFYGANAPVEEFAVGDGVQVAFITAEGAVAYRQGGAGGTTYRHVFGVMVDGRIMVEGSDYTVAGGAAAPGPYTPVTITFAVAPPLASVVRFAYFTIVAKTFPQAVHASAITKPGAVRGRHIQLFLGTGGARQRIGGVQSIEHEATLSGDNERELGTEEPIGRTAADPDCSGTVTVRAPDPQRFMALLQKVTGVAAGEVIGYLNANPIPLEVQILNPKNRGQVLKTLYVADAIVQVPGTSARVNQPTDFALRYEAQSGTFSEFKGAKP